MKYKILDCTLRDGGYYTNWDFEDSLVDTYLKSSEDLPFDFIEVGYRGPGKQSYFGKYFYCPKYILEGIRAKSTKKIAVLLNEKDIREEMVDDLLGGDYTSLIDLIRIAVDPINMSRAIELAKSLKAMGYDVAFNVMYMSTWSNIKGFYDQIDKVDGLVDYFYLVDSFGGVYPDDVKETILKVKERTSAKIGFHGHNNLELGLINTLTAIEAGAEIVDATITGMGRGAGNLKMELLLTSLCSRYKLDVDFNALGSIVGSFEKLQEEYQWGTSLPYMVSGANSLPQKDVMEWVSKRFYSMNSIVQALNNQSEGLVDNLKLNEFKHDHNYEKVLIIGGGPSAQIHKEAINQWVSKSKGICIIHASSKNSKFYTHLENDQFFCLVGNEGHRLEENVDNEFGFVSKCILPPFPRKMGTYIPHKLVDKSFELPDITFTDKVNDSHTVLALQTALELKVCEVYFIGYDGYSGNQITQLELELSKENTSLFEDFVKSSGNLISLTSTNYVPLKKESVYSKI